MLGPYMPLAADVASLDLFHLHAEVDVLVQVELLSESDERAQNGTNISKIRSSFKAEETFSRSLHPTGSIL